MRRAVLVFSIPHLELPFGDEYEHAAVLLQRDLRQVEIPVETHRPGAALSVATGSYRGFDLLHHPGTPLGGRFEGVREERPDLFLFLCGLLLPLQQHPYVEQQHDAVRGSRDAAQDGVDILLRAPGRPVHNTPAVLPGHAERR